MSHKKPTKSTRNESPQSATSSVATPSIAQTLPHTTSDAPRWLGWVLFALAWLLYANTLGHGYAFDDSIVITENQFTKQGLAGIKDLATRDFFEGIYGEGGMELAGGRYRPLSLVMFAIEYQFFGLNPAVGHFINVLLYALTGVLLFGMLRQWLRDAPNGSVVAFIASLLFIAHPIHTEVVANIKSRDEILALLFAVLAMRLLHKSITVYQSAINAASVGAWVCLFLAMLAKENALVFALVLPLALTTFYRKSWGESIGLSMPFLGAVGLYFALRYAFVGGIAAETNPDIMENPFVQASASQKFGTIGVILLYYVQLLVLPTSFSCDYSFNQIHYTSLLQPISLLGWGLYAAAGLFALKAVANRQIYGYAIFLFMLPLGMTSNIFINIGAPMGERFAYMASLGYAMGVAAVLVSIFKVETWQSFTKKVALLGILVATMGYFGYQTIARNAAWRNNETLFATDVKNAPNSAKIHYYYGNTLLKKYLDDTKNPQGKTYLQQALKEMLRAYEINPQFHTNTYNIGLVYWNLEDGQKAHQYLSLVLQQQPTHILANELIGKVYGRFLNQPDKAIEHLERVIYQFQHPNVDNLSSLGIVYAMKGNLDKAITLLEEALKLDQNNGATWQNLAAVYAQQGNTAKAQECAQRAQALLK